MAATVSAAFLTATVQFCSSGVGVAVLNLLFVPGLSGKGLYAYAADSGVVGGKVAVSPRLEAPRALRPAEPTPASPRDG